MDQMSDEEIQDIVLTANLTPRKCLGFLTPFQAIIKELGKDMQSALLKSVALRIIIHDHVIITGNLQKLKEEIVSWVWPFQGKQAKRESIMFILAWLGYAMGAVAGTLAADFYR